jgi:alkanesulfonate monooxygenase
MGLRGWSESTKDSAIMGTVDECVEQLKAHLAVGVQKIIFVPYKYEMAQIGSSHGSSAAQAN